MKYIIAIALISTISISLISCKKSDASLIVAKWQIVNDSSSLSGAGISAFTNGHNYIGTPADYYDFRNDGTVYVKEGSNLDTMGYKVMGDSVINFYPDFTSGYYSLNITSITNNKLTLLLGTNPASSANLTPEGYEVRIINLKK